MDKSQLRRLALDFAQGHVDHESYVRERTELIDGIVSGQIAIEREAPKPPPPPKVEEPDEPSTGDTVQMEAPVTPQRRLTPLHVAIGGVVIAAAAAFFLTGEEEPVPAPVVKVQPPPPATIEPIAKQLVDQFVAANHWGTDGLEAFTTHWTNLSGSERDEAQSAAWFRPLRTALKQEINAQRALAGLGGGESTRLKGKQLVSFAKNLGVAGPFPDFAPAPSPSDSEDSSSEAAPETPSADTTTDPPKTESPIVVAETPSETVITPEATDTSTSSPEPTETVSTTTIPSVEPTESTASWLDSQPDDAIALQLFAVTKLDEVEKLIAAHPNEDLHLLKSPGGALPLFRVVKGPYPDDLTAKAAFAALPEALKRGQKTPLVRRVFSLRENSISMPLKPVSTKITPSAATELVQTAAPRTGADGFTLQLLASDLQENVQRIVEKYPELALRVHRGTELHAPFRVLYGDFPTADHAKAALEELPSSLLDSVGGPLLVKSSREPDGAVITVATRP